MGNEIRDAIYEAWKRRGDAEPQRRYLGCSVIGHECDRYLWLHFRGVAKECFEGRMYRLFERGRREEQMFVRDLTDIGMEVHDRDPGGGQFEARALGGHLGGHCDAVARNVPGRVSAGWHLVEMKTHNSTSFRKLENEGVMAAKPMHYSQMQQYCGLLHLQHWLYIAVNKDTDEIYVETGDFDRDHAAADFRRAREIIKAQSADKCATRATDFRCKMCAYAQLCWPNGRLVSIDTLDCRSCKLAHADIENGGWTCELGKATMLGEQYVPCSGHRILTALVNAAEIATDTYRLPDGTKFENGTGLDGESFSSFELMKLTIDEISNGQIRTVKEKFRGQVAEVKSAAEEKANELESLRRTLTGEERALEYADGAAYSQSKDRIAALKARIAQLEGGKE